MFTVIQKLLYNYFNNIMEIQMQKFKYDGIGQKLSIGSIVVRRGFAQYAGVKLYKIVKESDRKVTIAILNHDITGKIITPKLDISGNEICCAVYPETLIDVTSNVTSLEYIVE